MASSSFATTQYTSEEFVESSGAILFDFSQAMTRVCLIHYLAKNEWLLAKGRRNCGEPRLEAALREVHEETGYPCRPYPVTMSTRAPPATETGSISDQARSYPGLTDPFMLTTREVEAKKAKLIWWYIAEVDKDALGKSGGIHGESDFVAAFLSCDDALQKLTFEDDRSILKRAINLVADSPGNSSL
ncbi:hypothetical protein MKZ38_009395 [Zalerion maritima]|uniref:Nudix hydrolase domain-containing protein n=1 Tax=Zalerion maritima TaxID=339359 RepID=A0AAD5RUJ2_9PEZI|nr:hypothetical protein MKZ38_009395 [Zalerion maritima]